MRCIRFKIICISKLEIDNLTNQISPKIFELISTATVPILINGEYSKVINDQNYIKVNKQIPTLAL